MFRNRVIYNMFLVVLAALTALEGADNDAYRMTALSTLGGVFSTANDINNSGQVVGYSYTNEAYYHAFVWSKSTGMRDIGTLGGLESFGYGINNYGQIVGMSYNARSEWRGFLYGPNSGMIELYSLLDYRSFAYAVNDSAMAAGKTYQKTDTMKKSQGVYWTSPAGQNLIGTFGGEGSVINGINNSGHFVGSSYNSSDRMSAFICSDGAALVSLGTLGGYESEAKAINDKEQVVGYSTTVNSFTHAFVWSAEQGMQDIAIPNNYTSYAYDINNKGIVVGYAERSGKEQAFIWDEDKGMRFLEDLVENLDGWQLNQAVAINDWGQIAGNGINPEGNEQAFVLTVVPEPVGMILLLSGWFMIRKRTAKRDN